MTALAGRHAHLSLFLICTTASRGKPQQEAFHPLGETVLYDRRQKGNFKPLSYSYTFTESGGIVKHVTTDEYVGQ